MTDNKKSQYIVQIGEEAQLWDADKLTKNSEKLASSYPDAQVYQLDDYDSAEAPSEGFSYIVTIGNESQQWDAAKLTKNQERLFAKYPDAKIQKVSAWANPYVKTETQKAKENLDAFRAENGAFLDDFEARDTAERKQATAASMRGVAVPAEDGITGKEREMYYGLLKQEEELKRAYYNSPDVVNVRLERGQNISAMQREVNSALTQMENDSPEAFRELKRSSIKRANPRTSLMATKPLSAGAQSVREDYTNYQTAQNLLDDAVRMNNAPGKYDDSNGFVNYLRGMGDTFSDADFWTAGLTEIADNMNLRPVLAKVQDKLGSLDDLSEEAVDGVLTDSEKKILAAFVINTEAQYDRAEDLSRAVQAGQSAAESLGFMAEFILTGGVASGARAGVKAGVKKVLGDYLGRLAGKASKTAVGKYGKRLAGDIIEAAARTGVMPSTYRNMSQKAVEINEDPETGERKLASIGEAVAMGFSDSFVEALAEGGRVGALGNFMGDVLGAVKPARALMEKVRKSDIAQLVKTIGNTEALSMLRAGGWHGIGEEYLEEWYGAALRTLTNIEPDALKDFATVDSQIITLTSFIPMTLIGGTASTGAVLMSRKDLEKKAAVLKSAMIERGYSEDQANLLVDNLRTAPMQKISDAFTPVVNKMAQQENGDAPGLMKAVSDFAMASAKMQSYGFAYEEQEAHQRRSLLYDMEERIGRFWQEDAEGNRTVELSTLEDGTPVYILKREEQQNGVTMEGEIVPMGPEAMAVDMDGNVRFVNAVGESETMSLDDYLNTRLIERRGAEEEARMAEEAERYTNDIKSQIVLNQTILNMGTQENPIEGLVVGMTANGVTVQTQEGITPLTLEEVGNKLSMPNPVRTDAQIDEAEAANLEAQKAAREAMLDEQFGNPTAVEEDIAAGEVAEEVAEGAVYNYPRKSDGSVDSNALWNENVREWVKWNNQRIAEKYGVTDNGADSVNYLQNQIASLEKSAKQITNNKNKETDLDKRMRLEDDEIAVNKRLAELRSIFTELTGQEIAVGQESAAAPTDKEETEQAAGAPAENAYAEPAKPRERSIESEIARLYDMGLNNDEVTANLDAQIEKAQKAFKAQSKKAPKMGADAEAYVSKKQEHAKKMSELQQELDFWNGARQAVNEVLAQQSAVPDTAGAVTAENDPEPQNAVEFAARELGLRDGGIKLLWDSFKRHTGYGESERNKFFGLFRTRQNGGMTIEEAGERLMELDRENNTGFFDQNDPNAGMNAILDALGYNQTIGELRSYIARQRQAEAQREAEAAYSAMMAEYEATYGETMEESAHYDEVMRSEIFLNGLSENEQQELNNIIFAEEISQNGTEGHQTEASGVYGSETGSNATDVEPGTEGVYPGSTGVLQETQSDNSGGNAEPQESQRESDGESGKQDALSSVPSGEQTAIPAVESSLDEDMPDFTNSASAYFRTKDIVRRFFNMKGRINGWSRRLGVKVSVAETLDDVTNRQARAQILKGGVVFGFFDPATGEVVIYLPDFLGFSEEEALSEIDKTFIHEVVSHKGLRELLGEEKYGELCDMVWDAMTAEQQKKYLNYPGVNGDKRAAADEFIAAFAENVDYADNRTMWDKIVDYIKSLFESVELPVEISNEAMADLLRQSYRRLAKSAKAARDNRQAAGNVSFRTESGSLIGMHNISEDKLRKVIKQGGSANPSTAVIDVEGPALNSYGEISLIMPSSLVDAGTGRNAGTFTADAWTPTYPHVSKRFSDDKLQRAYWRDVSAIPEEMQSEVRMAFDSWLEDRNANGLAYMFLHERGEAPEIVRIEAKFPQEIKDKVSAILGEDRSGLYQLSDEEKQSVLELYIQENFGGSREDFDKSIAEQIQRIEERLSTGKVSSFVGKRITLSLQWMKEHGYDYDNLSAFVDGIVSDIRHAGEANDTATTNKAREYIKDNGLEGEYERWKESLNERYGIKEYLFGGYTPSGIPRWLPNTVENASRLMNKEGLAGATGLSFGFNRFIATLTPKRKSLSDIRESRSRLVEDDKLVDDFREKWSEVLFDLGMKCQPDAKGFEDYGLARLTEAAQKKNPGAYLKKEYGVELSQEDLRKLDEMIKAIKTEFPTRYFETKFQRPVYLNEFAAAVMPTTTSEDVKQAVAGAGLPIFEYDSSVEGSRREATIKASEGEGIRFRASNENQAIFVSNAAKAVEGIKQEKATPEQWLKMIEKNGGLKTGEDKWMGLSDWLKSSDKKTLTKQEVLDFINENMIIIEEVHYREGSDEDFREMAEDTRYALQEIYDDYIAESEEMTDDMYMSTHYDYAIQKLAERLGYEAWNAPFVNMNATIRLDLDPEFAVAELNDIRKRLGMASIREERSINETRLGYTTNGLVNLREIALTVPTIDPYYDGGEIHFSDAGDGRAIAWIRFGDASKWSPEERDDGKKGRTRKVLVIDEIQSQRHQKGREKGYKSDVGLSAEQERLTKVLDAKYARRGELIRERENENENELTRLAQIDIELDEVKNVRDYDRLTNEADEIRARRENRDAEIASLRYEIRDLEREQDEFFRRKEYQYSIAVPDAPFDKNWHELAMKRMLRYAAENGYDVIAWTKGDQQAERYSLAQYFNEVSRFDLPGIKERRFELYGSQKHSFHVNEEGQIVESTIDEAIGKPLADVVGKELAVKMMSMENPSVLNGEEIAIGGEGMKGFYDKILPSFMNKYGKKWGIKVEDIALPALEDGNLTMHSVPVTEEMKSSVMEGQVMFRARREDESAMEFHQAVVDEHKSRYNDIAEMEVFPINEATAKRFGYTLEKLRKLSGLYVSSEDLIAIFANEDETDSIEIEDTIFHESIHKLVDFFDHLKAVGEWMWSVADKYAFFADHKKHIEQEYSEDEYAEEMMCFMLGGAMPRGLANELLSHMPESIKKNCEQIFNEIGYDRTRESIARVLGYDGEPAVVSEVASEERREDEGRRRSEEKKEGSVRYRAEIVPEVQDEMDAIHASAIVMGNFMKAPNGKDTNLTEEQWLMVRTKGFKNWFGDWLNDPENASKVVDENGEPKVVYHGTLAKNLTQFDKDFVGSRYSYDEKGFFFISRESIAKDYATPDFGTGQGTIIPAFINLKNPLSVNQKWATKNGLGSRVFKDNDVIEFWDNYQTLMIEESENNDGVIISDGTDLMVVAFEPSQIKSANENIGEFSTEDDDIRYRTVTDQETLDRLNSEPTIKVYRAMQVIDGKLYPPMSAKVDGKLREPIELGQWEEAEERPELVDDKGRFKLDKGNKTSIPARYNPYFHTSRTPLNDQFSLAQTRPNLVIVEVEIPESELSSGYKAEKAKDTVGEKEWKAGVVQGKLSGTRKVILSRWDKPVRIVPDSEVAERIVEMFDGMDITMPSNVVTPSLRTELEKLGVPFIETNNQGKPVETSSDVRYRTRPLNATPADEVVTNGLHLTPAQTAELAGNVFAALPEESRKKITDSLNGNILGLQDAILQIPASLAAKEEWNDEDREIAGVIAREVQSMIDAPMKRSLSASEALWMLYDATHRNPSDIVEAAQKAFVKDRLGFSDRRLEEKQEMLRFRAATQAEIDAMERNMTAADLYNRDVTSAIMRLRESFQDMYRSVQKMMDAIVRKTGKAVEPFEDIMLALNQLSSKNLADKGNFIRKFLMPMWDAVLAFKENGHTIEDVTRYVMLKHGLERNDVLAQRDARNYYKDAYDKKVRDIEADKSLSDAEKQDKKDKAKDDFDFHVASVQAGTDAKYRELRERDYGAVMALYSDYVDIPDRMPGETVEQFNQRQRKARRPKYTDLAAAEAEAAREVAAFENANRALCDRLWKRINAATKETLKHQYEHNVISRQTYDHVRGMFEFYIPLRGFKEDTAEDIYSYYGKDISTDFANPLIRTKGRTTLAESPFGWIGSMAESAIQMDNKNDTKMRLYYFAVNRPGQNLLTIQKTWYRKTGTDADGKSIWKPSYPDITSGMDYDQTRQEIEMHDAEMKALAASGLATQKKSELSLRDSVVNIGDRAKPEHAISVVINGEEQVMYVNGNPRAAQAINGLLNIDRGDSGVYRVLGQKITRWMSQMNTSYNPAFWLSNYERDFLFTLMNVNVKEDKDYQRSFWRNYVNPGKVTQLLRKYESGTLDESVPLERMYKEFADNGGVTGYTVLANNEEYDRLLEKHSRDAQRSGFIKGAKNVFGAIQDFGEGVEQASRFAAYVTSRQMGRHVEQAIGDAKDVTVNFNRKGSGKAISWDETAGLSYGRYVDSHPKLRWCARVMTMLVSGLAPAGRSVYMFFNASIQGLKAFGSLMKRNPGKMAMWSGAYFGMGFALVALNHMINAMLGGDDDDYLDIPDWERRNNILIGGNGFYLKWALPQEARPFYAIADIIYNKMAGRSPDENLVEEVARALLEVMPVNPMGEGGLVQAVVPSALSPIYEVWQNTDYKGMPLYRESYWSTGNEPKYDKAFSGTGKVFVEISRLLNDVTGGDYAEAGWANIHPATIEHIIEGYGGGTVTFFNQLMKTLTGNYFEGEWSVRNTPFLNRVVTINDERYRNSHTSDLFRYYENLAKETKRIYNVYKANGDVDKLDELMDEERYEIMRIYERCRKREEKYDELIRDAQDDGEKRELMAEQDEMRREMIKEISEL